MQAAVTVIGRRNPRHDRQRVNLTGANLTGADLGGVDLTGANLFLANLTRADLVGALLSPDDVVPEGWQQESDSGRLKRADASSGGAATN